MLSRKLEAEQLIPEYVVLDMLLATGCYVLVRWLLVVMSWKSPSFPLMLLIVCK